MTDHNLAVRESVAKTIGNLVLQTLEQGATVGALAKENEALQAQLAEMQKSAEAAKPAKAKA